MRYCLYVLTNDRWVEADAFDARDYADATDEAVRRLAHEHRMSPIALVPGNGPALLIRPGLTDPRCSS